MQIDAGRFARCNPCSIYNNGDCTVRDQQNSVRFPMRLRAFFDLPPSRLGHLLFTSEAIPSSRPHGRNRPPGAQVVLKNIVISFTATNVRQKATDKKTELARQNDTLSLHMGPASLSERNTFVVREKAIGREGIYQPRPRIWKDNNNKGGTSSNCIGSCIFCAALLSPSPLICYLSIDKCMLTCVCACTR